jgi:hypothetical protein
MKQRHHIFRRENGIYYALDTLTRKRQSLNTTKPEEAHRLLNALNEACKQPAINLQIARVAGCIRRHFALVSVRVGGARERSWLSRTVRTGGVGT